MPSSLCPQEPEDVPIVKRYPNRKLYDTEAKRYITLDDIARLVRAGRDVKVLDHDSGADVTDITLAQVALQPTRERVTALPRSMLRHVIRFGDVPVETLRRRLDALVEELRLAGELSQAGADRLHELGATELQEESGFASLVERQVGAVLRRLGLPSHEDMLALGKQVDALAQQLHEMQSDAGSREIDD